MVISGCVVTNLLARSIQLALQASGFGFWGCWHLPNPKDPNPDAILEAEAAAGQGEEEAAAGKEGCPNGVATAAEEDG